MNYTENYRLNQWDPEDRILREEFNRDNANVESGLTTLKQGLETETKSREAAVSAARQEATQAVNAAKQETSQALAAAAGALESSKADKTALARLQALVDAMPFVKLREVTVSQSANQVDVDVRDIKLDQYAYVLFVTQLYTDGNEARWFMVRINGLTRDYESENSGRTYLFHTRSLIYDASFEFHLMEAGGIIKGIMSEVDFNGSLNQAGSQIDKTSLQASQLQTVNFIGEDGGLIRQGGKIYIYGVKR